jgi:hypothetical protein
LRRVPCCRKRAVSMTESWILAGVHRYVRVAHFIRRSFLVFDAEVIDKDRDGEVRSSGRLRLGSGTVPSCVLF